MVTKDLTSLGALALFGFALFLAVLFLLPRAAADPTAASITSYSIDIPTSGSPENMTSPGGSITTMVLDALQQNPRWKGYIGNVTGSLTLDDSSGNTLFAWSLTGVTISGEVYVSRYDNLTFAGSACANATVINAEDVFNNMTGGEADSINKTFNYSRHQGFFVTAGTPIVAGDCHSTFTYINDSAQTNTTDDSPFQELLLQDANGYLIYVTMIEDDRSGFTLGNATYDFQAIVAESDQKASSTPFYFYTQIST